jgi:hypothetical protein
VGAQCAAVLANADLLCGFCCKALPLPSQTDSLAAQAGQVHLCRHCGAAYLLAGDRVNPRASIADALHVSGPGLQLTASACIAEVQGQPLYLVCGWDPTEMLSTVRVAQILDLHRATVQQHVREGRFPGALLGPAMSNGARGFWSIPRAALMAYLRDKGKPTTLQALRARP